MKQKSNEKQEQKNNNFSKDIPKEVIKKIFENVLIACGIMVYFIILNYAYSHMKYESLVEDIKVFSVIFLALGIFVMEKAYKKDNGKLAINSIEILVLACFSLSITHFVTLLKCKFELYILTFSYIFAIYYILKSIIIYTKSRKEYLDSLSDISEIVKKEEPTKKEATKRNKQEEQEEIKEENKSVNKTPEKKEEKKSNKKTTKNKKVEQEEKIKKATTKKTTAQKENKEKETKTTKKKKEGQNEEPKSELKKEKQTKKATEAKKTSKTKTIDKDKNVEKEVK